MPREPERSVSEALFDPLPAEERARIDKAEQARREAEAQRAAQEAEEQQEARAAKNRPARRANPPKSPWQFRLGDWKAVLKTTVQEISRDRVTSVAGGVVFFGLLALFPAITALVSVYGLIADPATIATHLDRLQAVVPEAALGIIRGQVEQIASAPGTALSVAGIVSLLASLWTANGGMKALISALNVAWFEDERRGLIKLNLVSMGMTLGAIALVIAMISAIAVIPAMIAALPLPEGTEKQISLIRWPIMFGVLILALAALYRWGPSLKNPKFHWISPGALLASVGLVAASALFSWYVSNFANYNEVYGSLGAVVILMMWLWVAAIVVMVGAELNSAAEAHAKALRGEDVETDGDAGQDRRA